MLLIPRVCVTKKIDPTLSLASSSNKFLPPILPSFSDNLYQQYAMDSKLAINCDSIQLLRNTVQSQRFTLKYKAIYLWHSSYISRIEMSQKTN